MSMTFSRSTRSLATDVPHHTLAVILLTVLLLLAWSIWFTFAQIGLYQVSQRAVLVGESRVVADFPPDALGHLRRGQPATLQFRGFAWPQYEPIPATVDRVRRLNEDGSVQVELLPHFPQNSPIPRQPGLQGTAEVQVAHVTPFDLVLRTVGRRLSRTP